MPYLSIRMHIGVGNGLEIKHNSTLADFLIAGAPGRSGSNGSTGGGSCKQDQGGAGGSGEDNDPGVEVF